MRIPPFVTRNKLVLLYLLLVTGWCSQRNMGWMIVLLAPPALVYQLARLGFVWKNRVKRKDCWIAFGAIAVSILLVAAAHVFHHYAARHTAESLVVNIERFKAQQGRYPEDEAEVGITDSNRRQLYRARYAYIAGRPTFSYPGTFGLFHKWEYDFATGTWSPKGD